MHNHKAARATPVSAGATLEQQLSLGGLFAEYAENPDAFQEQTRKTPTNDPIYPDRPGFKDEGTSAEAARRVSGYSPQMRRMVLAKLREFPAGLTADELATALNLSPFSARPRLSELKRLGEIEASGERRRNASGMSASVWRIASPPMWKHGRTA
jgi:hypothetical protein